MNNFFQIWIRGFGYRKRLNKIKKLPIEKRLELFSALSEANIDNSHFPWDKIKNIPPGTIKRWDIPIPIKTNKIARAEKAADIVEKNLCMTIFDRKSISNLEDGQIDAGIIFNEGSALGYKGVIDENSCGHVSKGIGSTSYPEGFMSNDGVIRTKLYVHLGSAKCDDKNRGKTEFDIALHELGHALGISGRHNGEYEDDVIFKWFWEILFIIYSHKRGEKFSGSEIYFALLASGA